MSINILKRSLLIISLVGSGLFAQDKVDAIEAARQAKAAAEKAAADAEAATDAAIEQAAKNAAKDARDKIKRAKIDEEARKIAEAKAAEEAELDAAASAAAEEAKRKMAEELGLEYIAPVSSSDVAEEVVDQSTAAEEVADEVVLKEKLGWNIGAAASVGLLSGSTFTSTPVGATFVITTPLSLDVGPFKYNVSIAIGTYKGSYDSLEDEEYTPVVNFVDDFNPSVIALGGNLTIADFIFTEGHVGVVGKGTGIRGFSGVTLERLLKKGLNLPVNLLVGAELFYSSDMSGSGNSSGWVSVGTRLDYSF